MPLYSATSGSDGFDSQQITQRTINQFGLSVYCFVVVLFFKKLAAYNKKQNMNVFSTKERGVGRVSFFIFSFWWRRNAPNVD